MYVLRVPWAVTKRQQRRLLQQQSFGLGQYIPLHTLALLLGLVFCVAAPLMSPIALLYFVTVNLTQRYQWLYTFSHPYEGAGRMWSTLFHQVGENMYGYCIPWFVAMTLGPAIGGGFAFCACPHKLQWCSCPVAC
jgi:hypothetical protein